MTANIIAAVSATALFQATSMSVPSFTTGIPAIDGLIVSSPVVGVLLFWLNTEKAEKKALTEENSSLTSQLVTLAETNADTNATIRERLRRIEHACDLRAA